LKAGEKPTILIFNKMDLYEKNTFDEWLDPSVKDDLLNQLVKHWQSETQNNAIFVSATERTNLENLRKIILDKVREIYAIRYPYKDIFYE
jgi:GTP-binding protein HflX